MSDLDPLVLSSELLTISLAGPYSHTLSLAASTPAYRLTEQSLSSEQTKTKGSMASELALQIS